MVLFNVVNGHQLNNTTLRIMSEMEKKAFQRLPTDVVPKNYKLELTPDLKAFSFEGKLEVANSSGESFFNNS